MTNRPITDEERRNALTWARSTVALLAAYAYAHAERNQE